MQFINFLLLVTLSLIAVNECRITRTLLSSNPGQWGSWGNEVFCPTGSYAEGYQIKFEGRQGSGDDTALNNIRLFCSGRSPGVSVTGHINSLTWGRWSDPVRCPRGSYLMAFKLRVEKNQGKGDDTAANAVKFMCRPKRSGRPKELRINRNMEGIWGSWGQWSRQCGANALICGMQIKFETRLKDGDDTALNDVKFFCCD